MHGFGDDWDDFVEHANNPLWRITHGDINKLDPLGGSLFNEANEKEANADREPSNDEDEQEDDLLN